MVPSGNVSFNTFKFYPGLNLKLEADTGALPRIVTWRTQRSLESSEITTLTVCAMFV